MNKKVILPAIILGLLVSGAVVWKTGVASAYFGGSTEHKNEMAEELAKKLNISSDQVETAMEEIRTEHQAERKAEISTKLDQAVSDSVITGEQKQKILDKIAENQSQKSAGKGQKGQNRENMEQWLKDNGINADKIHDYIGFDGRNGQENKESE